MNESGFKISDVDMEVMGQAKVLNELIAYQNGAVVSRTLIKKQSGTVTIFSFDQGEGLSEHTAPFDAMVIILDGTADVILSGESNELKSGDTIVMPANKPHAIKALSKFKMLLIMIKQIQ